MRELSCEQTDRLSLIMTTQELGKILTKMQERKILVVLYLLAKMNF